MNYEEFLEKLRATPRDWYVTYGRMIRLNEKRACPLVAVARLLFPEAESFHPAEITRPRTLLGMEYALADKIADAADTEAYPQIRADLLAACGLTEPTDNGGVNDKP